MKNVSFCDLKDDVVKLGNDCHSVDGPNGMAVSQLKYIIADAANIKQYYLVLGQHLSQLKNNESWIHSLGYLDFYSCVYANIGLDKSAVSRCIGVFHTFCKIDDGQYRLELKDNYKDFSYSQLSEMLSLDEDDRKQIMPDMTIKEIRDLKKKIKSDNDSDKQQSVATSQQNLKSGRFCNSFASLMFSVETQLSCHLPNIYKNIDFKGFYRSDSENEVRFYVSDGGKELEPGMYKLTVEKV